MLARSIILHLLLKTIAFCLSNATMGEFLEHEHEVHFEPLGISYRTVAAKLKVAPSTFNRLIQGQSNISSEMALRLSKTLGRTPESWLIMQNNYNLWQARQTINLDEVEDLVIS
ncbi:MAG: HigA family addiction module antitoxin [Candidatus Brocadia sp.]|nr:HigA family addiction module antitoxin [Candidatus Brocadia sp.]